MLNNFVIFGVPRCGSTHILQLLEQYLVKKYNVHREDENEFFNIFKKIPNNLYINHSIIKLHTWATFNNLIEYNLLNNRSIAVTRENNVEMFASWLIAMETNQWTLLAKDIHNKILPKKIIHMSDTIEGKFNIIRYVHSIVRFNYFLNTYNLPVIRYENTFDDIKKLYPDWEAPSRREYLIKQNDHTRYDYIHKNDIDLNLISIRELQSLVSELSDKFSVEFLRFEFGIPGLKANSIGPQEEIKVLKENDALLSTYPPFDGIPELKSAGSEFVKAFLNLDVSPEHVIPTCGSLQGGYISQALAGNMHKGKDTILYLDPTFPVTRYQAKFLGLNIDGIELYDNRGEKLLTAIKEKISSGNVGGLLWSSPNNPSWSCLNEEELKGIAELCDDNDILAI